MTPCAELAAAWRAKLTAALLRQVSFVDPFGDDFNPKCTLHAESPGAASRAHASMEASNRGAQAAAPASGADTGMLVDAPSDQGRAGLGKSAAEGPGAEGQAEMSVGVGGGAGLIFGAMFVRTPT